MAGTDSFGQLRLGEAALDSVADQVACQCLVGSQPSELGLIGRALCTPLARLRAVNRGLSLGLRLQKALMLRSELIIFDKLGSPSALAQLS